MSNLERFMSYAAAFEQTFVDDDWQRLAAYFTEDAVYRVTGLPFPCDLHGRDNIFAGMRKSLDGFDRKMTSRAIAPTGPPSEQDGQVILHGVVRYRRADSPEVALAATITVDFRDGLICNMHDAFALDQTALQWLGRYGADLDGSYT